jgi:signal transduction histidine kinase
MQQVLLNLMINGIEAMKDSGGELTIRSQLGNDGQLQISVSDTGVGLPSEKADQIFNAFFTTKPQGSGMGLAISRSIVESHGGRLWATDNYGSGATFQFTLPSVAEELKVPGTGTDTQFRQQRIVRLGKRSTGQPAHTVSRRDKEEKR